MSTLSLSLNVPIVIDILLSFLNSYCGRDIAIRFAYIMSFNTLLGITVTESNVTLSFLSLQNKHTFLHIPS